MMTSSNGNIFRVTGPLCGEFTGPGEFPTQRPVTRSLMFSLICVWINGWVNNRETGDLRRHRGHYDVIVMKGGRCFSVSSNLSRLDNSPKRIGMRWLLKPSQGCDDILQLVRLDRIPQRICLYITREPGPRLNIKTVLSTYGDFHVKDKTAVRTSYL